MHSQPEYKSIYVRKPLQSFLRSVEKAYESAFGRERSCRSPSGLPLYSLPSAWFLPGTVNCLVAPPKLSIPLFIKFLLDHADSNKDVASLFVSNVPSEEIVIRMTAYYSRIGINRLRRGQLSSADWPHLIRISSRIYESNIFFAHGNKLSIKEMVSKHSQRAEPLGLILVNDIFSAINELDNFNQGLIEILVSLRSIAEEYKVSIVFSCNLVGSFNEEPFTLIKDVTDLFMTLIPCAGKYELFVESRREGEIGNIPLIIIPEIGVMEDG